jgi:eukaryotic-like serine/threonine-protein kinase
MEHVDGEPLAGPVPIERAVAIAIQICDALAAAHRTGIVHRDLKPSNILISKSNPPNVKLLDFGLATRVDAHASHAADATISALTGEHKIVGTPQYMAPEQIEGRDADSRTDIFALGCVLYELVTGKRAFRGESPSAVMSAIIATEPRPMRELVPITPPTLEWIVTRCLAKNPDDRWQTVRDLRAARHFFPMAVTLSMRPLCRAPDPAVYFWHRSIQPAPPGCCPTWRRTPGMPTVTSCSFAGRCCLPNRSMSIR